MSECLCSITTRTNPLYLHIKRLYRLALAALIFSVIYSAGNVSGETIAATDDSILIKSMSFPTIWKPQVTPMLVYDERGAKVGWSGEINLGVYRDVLNPVIGLFGVTTEGYVRSEASYTDGGVRLFGTSRYLFVQGGLDYRLRSEEFGFITSINIPLLRGGPLGRGGSVRIDWSPGHTHAFGIGLTFPLAQPWQGRTRPKKDYVLLPKGSPEVPSCTLDKRLHDVLDNIKHAAEWINKYTVPFLDQNTEAGESNIQAFRRLITSYKDHIAQADGIYPGGHNFKDEVTVYHSEVVKAFSLTCGAESDFAENDIGAKVANKAREILLDEVILPYNRLLGQSKRHDSVLGYGKHASASFKSWLDLQAEISEESRLAALYVFDVLLKYIDDNRARSRDQWDDSRLVWIPMHYGLRFEDHDTEDEMDAIIEKAVEQDFTDANDVHYVVDGLFHPELSRMIQATRDYHVLWIHDFKGVDAAGAPDAISFETVMVYLRALIERVREYGEASKIPVYMIFLDQHYYELNRSHFWLELLADPLRRRFRMSDKYQYMEDSISALQKELRDAVAGSAALQANVKRFGEKWLYNRIKVQINITNPSDLSYRSAGLIPWLGYLPDNIMRDHRKISFYDVTESDPGKGEAIFTGLGVGAGYVGPTWDDRSILVRGPALVALKTEARRLLFTQGIAAEDIPPPLRPIDKPDNYVEMTDALRARGWTATALQVHNTTGFGPKTVDIVKAVLYNLMPNGSHLYIPDSIWINPFWGAMVIGASLRGCWVLVVSPALNNAPSASEPVMSQANELFARFVIVQNMMRGEIEAAGGLFRVGIYSMERDVGDVIGKLRVLNEGIAQSELFQKVFPFTQAVIDMTARMPQYLDSMQFIPQYAVSDSKPRLPRLHLKAQFFATERTINTLVPLESWEPLVKAYIIARAKQTAFERTEFGAVDLRRDLEAEVAAVLTEWYQITPHKDRERAVIYLTIGSHNEDYRSMIMDGEVLCVVSRAWAMVAYLDFVMIMAQTTWIDNLEQLNELLPRRGGFWNWLGRFLKVAL